MKILKVSWQDTMPLRHQVLWPDKAPEFCKVVGDEQALHFAVKVDDKIVSVASIYLHQKKARLRKFATLPEYQGQGLGTQLLTFIVNYLKSISIGYLWFDARETALSFYQGLGFKKEGDVFYKSDVRYFKMFKEFSE